MGLLIGVSVIRSMFVRFVSLADGVSVGNILGI